MNQGDGHPALPADTPKVAESRHVVECVPWQPVRYRYLLYIAFDLDLAGAPATGPILTVIQKNPSLADAARSDPTAGTPLRRPSTSTSLPCAVLTRAP